MNKNNLVTVYKFAEMKGVSWTTVYRRLKLMEELDENGVAVPVENPKGDIEVVLVEGVWYIDPAKNKKVTFRKFKNRKVTSQST